MADTPIDPACLVAWISDMRAQLDRIEQSRREKPPARLTAVEKGVYAGRRHKRASKPRNRFRQSMTQ